jgi:fructuronate reductase
MTTDSAETGRLGSASLPALAARGIAVPGYPRSGAPGVVHLGLGAFHRAHQALVFDRLLQRGDLRWGVFGVAMRSSALAGSLQAQDGLYAVQVASSAGSQWQIGGAIWQTAVAAREPALVVQAIAAPSTRWLTLTVTEKGYAPELAQLIVAGLGARHAMGLPGLTIASCDNLVGNGRRLQALCVAAARDLSPALAHWVAGKCAFPNSMVDRIVPAATPQRLAAVREALGVLDEAALGTEAFWEWVIERRFADAADADVLARAGVNVVDDVAPFEDAKLRLLNGSHSAMACMGAVAGWPVIGECITQPAVRSFIHGLMTEEVGPQLARPDWPAYRDALLARFANPALQHSVHQIATDSSQKIPQRWPPSVLGASAAGLPVERLAFAAAAWMRYLRGSDERGRAYAMSDPMAGELQALALAHAGDAAASVQALGRLTAIWGEVLTKDQRWLESVTRRLDDIQRLGVLGALEQLQALLDGR